MKKKIIFYLISLIFLLTLPAGAVKKIEANPINIASRLVLQQDSAEIASTLEYYGYAHQSSDNGRTLFRHANGSSICFFFPMKDVKLKFPIVQVKSHTNVTALEKTMEQLQYIKKGDHYEHVTSKYSTYLTRCTFDPDYTVTFQRLRK